MKCHTCGRNLVEGGRFGRWTILSTSERSNNKRSCLCRCDCGTVRIVMMQSLRAGISLGCGCVRTEKLRKQATKHGGIRLPEYNIWKLMKARCSNPRNTHYSYYGGRGIRVCESWMNSFEKFLSDMGSRPTKFHTIDRIDTNGNYQPSNCRWATRKEQQNNMRSNTFITVNGESKSMSCWAQFMGLRPDVICHRLKSGWSKERAVLTPLISKHSHPRNNHANV